MSLGNKDSESPHPLRSAAFIAGKYSLVRELGRGGMGAVYEAVHTGTGRRVALKVLATEDMAKDPKAVARFYREAQAAAAVDSRHIAQVLDVGSDGGRAFMVMELLSGEDIAQAIKRVGPLDPNVVVRVAAQACLGLARAHDVGIVHRDIKSANLFLSQSDGGAIEVKLLDFGIAMVRGDLLGEVTQLTQTSSLLGSPLYMSPEQTRSAKYVDHRSDIWSLGVVLYEALVGHQPLAHVTTMGELIVALCTEPVGPIQHVAPWVSPSLARIVHQALSISPASRFATVREMHAALVALSPDGIALRQADIAPLTAARRAERAPLMFAGLPAPSSAPALAESGGASSRDLDRPQDAEAITASSGDKPASAPHAPRPTRSLSRRLAWVGGSAILLGVPAGVLLVGRYFPHEAAVHASPSAEPLASASVSSAPTARTVRVAIKPPTAQCEVDGVPTPVVDGFVSVTGALQSTHAIRVMLGKAEQSTAMVITELGPIPSDAQLPQALTRPETVPRPGRPPGPQPATTASRNEPTSARPAGSRPGSIDRNGGEFSH